MGESLVRPVGRFLALFLSITLTLPNSAFALRPQEKEETPAGLEELTAALTSGDPNDLKKAGLRLAHQLAGLEERPKPTTFRPEVERLEDRMMLSDTKTLLLPPHPSAEAAALVGPIEAGAPAAPRPTLPTHAVDAVFAERAKGTRLTFKVLPTYTGTVTDDEAFQATFRVGNSRAARGAVLVVIMTPDGATAPSASKEFDRLVRVPRRDGTFPFTISSKELLRQGIEPGNYHVDFLVLDAARKRVGRGFFDNPLAVRKASPTFTNAPTYTNRVATPSPFEAAWMVGNAGNLPVALTLVTAISPVGSTDPSAAREFRQTITAQPGEGSFSQTISYNQLTTAGLIPGDYTVSFRVLTAEGAQVGKVFDENPLTIVAPPTAVPVQNREATGTTGTTGQISTVYVQFEVNGQLTTEVTRFTRPYEILSGELETVARKEIGDSTNPVVYEETRTFYKKNTGKLDQGIVRRFSADGKELATRFNYRGKYDPSGTLLGYEATVDEGSGVPVLKIITGTYQYAQEEEFLVRTEDRIVKDPSGQTIGHTLTVSRYEPSTGQRVRQGQFIVNGEEVTIGLLKEEEFQVKEDGSRQLVKVTEYVDSANRSLPARIVFYGEDGKPGQEIVFQYRQASSEDFIIRYIQRPFPATGDPRLDNAWDVERYGETYRIRVAPFYSATAPRSAFTYTWDSRPGHEQVAIEENRSGAVQRVVHAKAAEPGPYRDTLIVMRDEAQRAFDVLEQQPSQDPTHQKRDHIRSAINALDAAIQSSEVDNFEIQGRIPSTKIVTVATVPGDPDSMIVRRKWSDLPGEADTINFRTGQISIVNDITHTSGLLKPGDAGYVYRVKYLIQDVHGLLIIQTDSTNRARLERVLDRVEGLTPNLEYTFRQPFTSNHPAGPFYVELIAYTVRTPDNAKTIRIDFDLIPVGQSDGTKWVTGGTITVKDANTGAVLRIGTFNRDNEPGAADWLYFFPNQATNHALNQSGTKMAFLSYSLGYLSGNFSHTLYVYDFDTGVIYRGASIRNSIQRIETMYARPEGGFILEYEGVPPQVGQGGHGRFRVIFSEDGQILSVTPLGAGLEEQVTATLAQLAEAVQGPGVLVIETDVISQRVDLEEFVARIPAGLKQRIILYGDGLVANELMARNNIALVTGDLTDLAVTLAGLEQADRIGFMGDPGKAQILSRMLPMQINPIDPKAGLEQILLELGIPRSVLHKVNTTGLEEQLTRLRAA